jgi:cytoskeletal protein RodZ
MMCFVQGVLHDLPPYLTLQYLWASGKAFTNYGFILYSATVVPLQGVWNWFVYTRNRQLKEARHRLFNAITSFINRRRSSNSSTKRRSSQVSTRRMTTQMNENSNLVLVKPIKTTTSPRFGMLWCLSLIQ